MARRLKQTSIKVGDTGLVLPVGSTAARPVAPANGTVRYNTDLSRLELYFSSAWSTLPRSGNVSIVKDAFTGNAVGGTFVLSVTPPDANAIVAYVGNVHQEPTVAYSVASNQITFTSIPGNGVAVEVYHNFNSTNAA